MIDPHMTDYFSAVVRDSAVLKRCGDSVIDARAAFLARALRARTAHPRKARSLHYFHGIIQPAAPSGTQGYAYGTLDS